MPTIKDRDQVPDNAKPVIDLVERLGFKWEFDYEYAVPNTSRRVQIREEKHHAPKGQVSRYKNALKQGDKFAPIVVSKDGFIVDGNTRSQASSELGYPTIQAVILDRPWEGTGAEHQKVQRRMKMLGAGFNVRNGKGIDNEEIRLLIEFVGEGSGYDATRIAALIGVTATTVTNFFHEKTARERAEELGVRLNGSLSATQLRALGKAKVNDRPWKAVAELTQKSGMKAGEIDDLVKRSKDAGDDQKALSLIEHEEEVRADQIADYTASGKSIPPAAARLRQKLGTLLQMDADSTSMVERTPGHMEEHLDVLQRSLAILERVIDEQQQAIDKRDAAVAA
jgi:ParB-like chromosome segregation protein Spo0J